MAAVPTDGEPITLLTDEALDVKLALHPYRLIPGYRGELGLPVEAFLALYAVREGRPVASIETPTDLSRFVTTIQDEGEALSFVQLFTAPETQHLFPKDETVIDLSVVPDSAPARVGTVAASLGRELGVEEPHVTRTADAFIITRSLVRAISLSGPRVVLRRTERVSEDGRYQLLREETLGELPADAVRIPYYE